MTTKKLIIMSLIGYVISTVAGWYISGSGLASVIPTRTADATPTLSPTPSEPLTEECPTNGKMYGASAKAKWDKRRPLAVVIENHQESRPQSGISSADVVYEALSESGVTRTLSIYYCQDAKVVGPVRSARVHFINLLREWGNSPLYAHVGGANCDRETGSGCGNGAPADALGLIGRLGWNLYNDMNQFSIPYPYYYRDYDRLPDVATEHTMYSSTAKLWEYAAKNRKLTQVDEDGVRWDEDWAPWKFQDDTAAGSRGDVKVISHGFYSDTDAYSVRWEYSRDTNSYLRFNGGKAHLDKNTSTQLTAKNVIIVEAVESPANDGYPGGHILYKLVGSGKAHIYQNGREIKGTWTKDTLADKMVFTDEDDKEVRMVRGVTWITVIPVGADVTAGSGLPTPKAATTGTTTKTPTSKTQSLDE